MEELLPQLGIGSILALLIIDKFLMYQKTKGSVPVDLQEVANNSRRSSLKIEEMHDWLSMTDADGVKLIYSRNKQLDEALSRLSRAADNQTQILQGVVDILKDVRRDVTVALK